MKVLSPYEQLPEQVRSEIESYIETGNSFEDLMSMFLENLTKDQMNSLIDEVKEYHQSTGDCPNTDALVMGVK